MSDNPLMTAEATYNIARWSEGYFTLSTQGTLVAKPLREHGASVDLFALTKQLLQQGLTLPVLVRFNDILRDRIVQLQQAFNHAMHTRQYQGGYTAVYPIKVNQQRLVVQQLLHAGGMQAGLEAGSKPELLAVLSLVKRTDSLIVCNGYKDKEYIRLALLARSMGHRVYLIIEKYSELALILEQAQQIGIEPLLGVRVRLASIGKGKWQNTGGEKSKFGLTTSQLLAVVNSLQHSGKTACLQLLHFHLGSQISNIRDIQTGLAEAARFYAELWGLGVTIHCVDVGGGLGIDYEGTCSRHYCSTNYSMTEYANNVVAAFADICAATALPHPHIISESGRALSAHHAVLLTNTIGIETITTQPPALPTATQEPRLLQELRQAWQQVAPDSALEAYHTVMYCLQEVYAMYRHGLLTLAERACAEQIYQATCVKIRGHLDPSSKSHREVLDELNECLADKLFVNFSLFQSLPDVWAIDQIFPVLPLYNLDQPLQRRGIVQDITCDSDGRIDSYADGHNIEATLALPAQTEPYLLGFFLVGAYQEILGDIHNLFGDTHSVHVELDGEGGYRLLQAKTGDTVAHVLQSVDFSVTELMASYREQLQQSTLTPAQQARYLQEFSDGLQGYTYLEEV